MRQLPTPKPLFLRTLCRKINKDKWMILAFLKSKKARFVEKILVSMNQPPFVPVFDLLCIDSTIHLFLKHHWLIWPVSSDVVLLPWFPSATVCTKVLSVQNSSVCSHCRHWPTLLTLYVTGTELEFRLESKNWQDTSQAHNFADYYHVKLIGKNVCLFFNLSPINKKSVKSNKTQVSV